MVSSFIYVAKAWLLVFCEDVVAIRVDIYFGLRPVYRLCVCFGYEAGGDFLPRVVVVVCFRRVVFDTKEGQAVLIAVTNADSAAVLAWVFIPRVVCVG